MIHHLKRRASLLLVPALLLLAVALVAGACGGSEAEGDPNDGGDPADGGSATYDVSMGDNFFEPKEFTFSAGQTVTVNLKNDGIAIHNFRFAGPDNEYNTEDDAISDPALVNPDQSVTLTFTAPASPGSYGIRCDVHPTDMLGAVTVQ